MLHIPILSICSCSIKCIRDEDGLPEVDPLDYTDGEIISNSNMIDVETTQAVVNTFLHYDPRLLGIKKKDILDDIVENSLHGAALWNEVNGDLNKSGLALSGGQQQRLCIARTIAVESDVILMDEPCSAPGPIATQHIEELMRELQKQYTIVIVTHNMQQAQRVSDYTAFYNIRKTINQGIETRWGELVEFNRTEEVFANPAQLETADYIAGRFG